MDQIEFPASGVDQFPDVINNHNNHWDRNVRTDPLR